MQFEKNELISAVKELIGVMKESGLGYISVKNDKFELELGQKYPEPRPLPPMPVMPPMAMGMQAAPTTTQAAAEAAPTAGKSITSPIVGTFYAAPAPDKAPFVKVGDSVNEGDVVCIVESMKVMNEVLADKSGVVTAIAVKDGEAVEFGQPIILLS
ncbi:MAG: acetyl-CoA carboxylase biotin carboxyl carrier protein [Ruminiclostridium sp.]|nr:acetyl-CoA carboxylase biotin carboxyl carrier protein [Ruminiclostridium sp.]